jgi:hypothetical protein
MSALVIVRLLAAGFANRDLRVLLARLLGRTPDTMTAGSLRSSSRAPIPASFGQGSPTCSPAPTAPLRGAFDAVERAMDQWCADAKLAA